MKREIMPKVPKISKATLNSIRKLSAKFIYVEKDGSAVCERCKESVDIKAKHLQKIKCPSCKKEMTVVHSWRRSNKQYYDWFVIPKVINNHTLMMRYILAYRIDNKIETVKEEARMILDFNLKNQKCFELRDGVWKKGTRDYFRETNMGWCVRQACCLPATEYEPLFFKELNKFEPFKYCDIESMYNFRMYPHSVVGYLGRRIDLYEKLQKLGMNGIIKEELKSYKYEIPYDKSQTSLTKMLGITKAELEIWKKDPTVNRFRYIKAGFADDEVYKIAKENNFDIHDCTSISELNLNIKKTLKYIVKNKINVREYTHYITVARSLGYADEQYTYPKDFRRMDNIVSEEALRRKDEMRAKKDIEQSILIKKISDGIKAMPDLQEFLNGSRGLLVYVPESAKELRDEGRALHNCIGTYVDRIAENKTLVFYVRQLSNPTAPFVAFEYCNGRVLQCRYDHNKSVDDNKIIDFVEAFANVLKKNNVLAA